MEQQENRQSVGLIVYILEAEKWGPGGVERQPVGVYSLPTLYAVAAEEAYRAELAGGEDGHNISFAARAEVLMDFQQLAESGTAMGAQTGMWRWWPAFGGDWEEVVF
jgi:hypothetical protein